MFLTEENNKLTFEGLPANKIDLTAVVSRAVSSPGFRSISLGRKELNWHANGQSEISKSYKEMHSGVLGKSEGFILA